MKHIILLSLVTLTASVKLPPNFKKCSRKQPDFEACVVKSANQGVAQLTRPFKEVNIPNLDPFDLPEATISGGSGRVAVDQKFKNCKLYGLPTIKIDKFGFDFDGKKVDMSGIIPEVKMLCEYEMKGQLLVFPINGKGNRDLRVTAAYDFDEVRQKDKTYLKFTTGDLALDPGLVIYDFQNAVDRRISDNINQVLNENWKDVFDDVKSGYVEIVNRIVINLLNRFFSKVSLEDAFD